jgi:hypothetical protein
MTTGTLQDQIRVDMEQAKDRDECVGYDGRVSITKMIRYAASMNPEATRAQFVETLVAMGHNRSTVGIQFAKSRQESALCGDVEVANDGSLRERI